MMAFEFDPGLAEKPQRVAFQLSPSVVRRAQEIAEKSGGKVDQVVEQALRYAFEMDGRRRRRGNKKGGKQAAAAG